MGKDSAVSSSRMSGFVSAADATKPQMTIAQISRLPSEFDISRFVMFGQKNLVVAVVVK
jgi:hypothetical protein